MFCHHDWNSILRRSKKMPTLNLLLPGIVAVLILVGTPSDSPAASDATQQLQSAVQKLNARLVSSPHAEGWRRYLLLNLLESQAAKGEQADVATLQMIHQKFASQANGLNHPMFADVRIALELQIQNLRFSNVGELGYAIAMAGTQFQPIGVEKMSHYRHLAINELNGLKQYYQLRLTSEEQNEVFNELKLDELITFLQELEFELAPEVSVGKMTSVIKGFEDQLDEVIKKIDALPFETPKTDQAPNQAQQGQDPTPTPIPDDDESLEDLNKQREALEARISELKQQRREIQKADAPRTADRRKNLIQFLEFEKGFEAAAKNYRDPYFDSTQLAFDRCFRGYLYGTSDNLQEDFLVRIERLAEELPKLDIPSERLAAGNVANALEWLENAFQVPHLVTAIRARYSLPNAYVTVTSDFINRVGSKPVSQSRPVNETVMGRLVRGRADSTGLATFDLVNDPNQVHVSIRLQASINSNTYVQQRSISAYIGADGQAEARRSVYANVGGFFVTEPYAAANIDSDFNGTSSKLCLINRIAQKQFDKQEQATNIDASKRVRDELLQQFGEQTSEPIAKGKDALKKANEKAVKQAALIPNIYARTQADKVLLVAKKSSKFTLASSTYPANFGIPSDIKFRVHETMLSNFVEPIFRGKTYTDKELGEELSELLGTEPGTLATKPAGNQPGEPNIEGPENGAPNQDTDEDESFSITFTNIRPVQFEFEDNGFAVVVSGRRFARGGDNISAAMKIILRFKIRRIDGKLILTRDGRAEIDYVDPEQKDAKVVAFRSFLENRLNPKDGAEEIKVELPANLIPSDNIEALKDSPVANQLVLNQCRVSEGWFYLGWNHVAENTFYPSMVVDLPAIWNNETSQQLGRFYSPVGETAGLPPIITAR